MSLFAFGVEVKLRKQNNQLLKLNELINWERFRKHFRGFYKKEGGDQGGQRPYDVVKMYKAVLLGQWHGLSEEELEQSLLVRLDFMLFTGFELGEAPDSSTLCRFRNRMITYGADVRLLKELNAQLEKLGLKVEKALTLRWWSQ